MLDLIYVDVYVISSSGFDFTRDLIHKREVWTQNYKFISKNTYIHTMNSLINVEFFLFFLRKFSQLLVFSPTQL